MSLETLRAVYQDTAGSFSATASTLSFRIGFIDSYGSVASSYVQGSRVYVRLEDHDFNDPASFDRRYVTVRSSRGDEEPMELLETGTATGLFEGSIELDGAGSPVFGDGRLQAGPGDELDARVDPQLNAAPAKARVEAAAISFIGETGLPTVTLLENGVARVRVVSPDSNGNPSVADSLGVQVRALYTGDEEALTLTETGADTDVFEGAIGLSFNAGAIQANGLLETSNQAPEYLGEQATASFGPFNAVARTVGSRVTFLNLRGQPVTSYSLGATVRVRVEDPSHNQSPAADSFNLLVDSSDGDQEDMTVTETSPASGIFEGSVPTPTFLGPSGDGVLTAGAGAIVQATPPHFNTPTYTVARVAFLNNQPPQAVNDTVETLEEQAVNVPVLGNDADPEAGPLTVAGVTQGAKGFVAVNPDGTVAYTPNAGETGEDTFTYYVTDVHGGEAAATVTVTIAPLSHAPVANDDAVSVDEDGMAYVEVLSNDSDPDDDFLSVESVTQGTHGSVSINPDNTVKYTPAPNYNGADSFTYTVTDGTGETDMATVTVTVSEVNDPPVAVDDVMTTNEDTNGTLNVFTNDSDAENEALTALSVTYSDHATAFLATNGDLVYQPKANYNGPDVVFYTFRDSRGATATGTVTITVTPVNDAPVASADSTSVAEDGTVNVSVLTNDTDVDNDTLTVASVMQGAGGVVSINPDNTVKYTPAANFHGSDSFTYTMSDGNGGTSTATVTVTITPVNDAPVANADSASVAEDDRVDVAVLSNDTDPENNTLTVTAVTQGAHGTVSIMPNNTVRYGPASNYNGSDSFTYTASDGNGGTATASVTMTITPVNDAPVAVNDTATVAAGSAVTISVRANDVDVDGQTLTITAVTQGTRGSVTINAGQTVTYTATLFVGNDSFTYTVSDGAGGTATATVTVTLTPPTRFTTDLQVRYDFDEGSGLAVNDTSGVGTPYNLSISAPGAVTWLTGALSVNSAVVISSLSAATKVTNAVRSSNAVTVEAWVAADNLTQTGPARIVSINKNSTQSNIIFGQTGNRYETQTRTSSGTRTQQTPTNSASLSLKHVVYTRNSSGLTVTYIDGVQVISTTATGSMSNWDTSFRLALANAIGGGKPWVGDLHLVAIYSRSLSSTEVQRNYLAGSNGL